MFCKHCGKEIADDSKFCQHCGGKQTEESVRSSRRNIFMVKHKILSYAYLIWLAVNIMALAYGMANPHEYHAKGGFTGGDFDCPPPPKEGVNTSAFYPFESYDIGNYDLSEFLVYTVAVPLCLFALVKLALLFVPLNTEK